jgi:hypothetical protein
LGKLLPDLEMKVDTLFMEDVKKNIEKHAELVIKKIMVEDGKPLILESKDYFKGMRTIHSTMSTMSAGAKVRIGDYSIEDQIKFIDVKISEILCILQEWKKRNNQ